MFIIVSSILIAAASELLLFCIPNTVYLSLPLLINLPENLSTLLIFIAF